MEPQHTLVVRSTEPEENPLINLSLPTGETVFSIDLVTGEIKVKGEVVQTDPRIGEVFEEFATAWQVHAKTMGLV